MRALEFVFAVGWAAFWLYWLVAAFSMKRGRVPWSRELRIRAVIAVVVILLVRFGAFRGHRLNTDPWRAGIGLVLFALGLGFAIWARMHIGRNWGTPMTQKDEPELVKSGPYHLVRHPIYSGILVAGVGTAVALGWVWLTAVLLAGVYFLYSATVEERYLTEQFPDDYPVYKRSTKMLMPFRLSQRLMIDRMAEFVPPDFDVPLGLETSEFVLEPLGPEHNELDYDAWTSSMEHIAATPGYPDGSWPRAMTRDENRADLQRHADDFRTRKGFTYTVLDPAGRDVIGCVYIYPLTDSDYDARALSWVRKSHAHLDTPLWRAVSEWLESDWPFATFEYAHRA